VKVEVNRETSQTNVWTGEFGREYTSRNIFVDEKDFNQLYVDRYGRSRDDINAEWLNDIPREARILEVGSNIGNQLRALRRLGFQHLCGIEIQRHCVEKAKEVSPEIDIIEGSAFDIPFKDGFFDLVFTNNVLIHINPKDLPKAMDEMCRVTRKHIWGFEYYAPEITEIIYRSHKNLLWKADYSRMFLDQFSDLELVRQEIMDCLDDVGNSDKFYLLKKSKLRQS